MKIMFVCLGNICRSPLAEAIFKHKIVEKGIKSGFLADSCGTANYHVGDPPDPRTIRNAEKNGVRINHAGRQISAGDLAAYDWIIPMDNSNLRNIFLLPGAEHHRDKIILMRAFDPVGKGKDVPDPYYGGEKEFQDVFDILNRSMDELINFLQQPAISGAPVA